jgi:cell wall-associated NlpC family hydrolase
MNWFHTTLLCTAMSVATLPAHSDELAGLLVQRGLVERLGDQVSQARDSVGDRASGLVMQAMGFLGVPYRYGGNSPETGLDCSGLVRLVYEQSIGKVLPRRAADQARASVAIDTNDLRPGDLVFFNTMRRAFSHVGIYVGDGKFIHAPSSGGKVRVENMRTRYWSSRFNGARRVPGANTELAAERVKDISAQ